MSQTSARIGKLLYVGEATVHACHANDPRPECRERTGPL